MPATRPAPTASPTRSTRWRWPARRCANRTCPSPSSTVPPGSCACWSTTAKTWSAERTRRINRLRWHLHELDPTWDPPARSLHRATSTSTRIAARLAGLDGHGRPHRRASSSAACRQLTVADRALEREITAAGQPPGAVACWPSSVSARSPPPRSSARPPTSAGSSSKDAFARHNGTAPLPVWSGNRERHRLSRTGNRQLNAAIHRIAITQARYHPDASAYLDAARANGNTTHRSPPRPQATPLRRRLPGPPRRRRPRPRRPSRRGRLT